MNYRLLVFFSAITLAFVANVVCAEQDGGKLCETEFEITGEVKSAIIVEFEEKKLKLFDDNGDKTDEKERTFTFEIIRLTSPGAKLKLSAGKDILYENNEWIISKQNSDDKCILEFSLLGTSKNGRLEQRAWDAEGNCYTFAEDDDVGKWCIVVEPVTKIKRESPGLYTGSLKISVVAE